MTPGHRARSTSADIGFGWDLSPIAETGRKALDFANASVRDFGELDDPSPPPGPFIPAAPPAPAPIVTPPSPDPTPEPTPFPTGKLVLGGVVVAAAIGVAWALYKKRASARRGRR